MARFIVTSREAGSSILELVRKRMKLSWSQAKRLFSERRVVLAGTPCPNPGQRLRSGQHIEIQDPMPQKPMAAVIKIRFLDKDIVVVEKPPGLTTMRHPEEALEFGHRAKKYLPPTLADLLPDLLAGRKGERRSPVRAVHRLDKDTSGLVVFARTPAAEGHLGRQFRAHTVARKYLAVVRGQAKNARIESQFHRDRGDGRRGSGPSGAAGKIAITNVTVVERLGDFTLVECRLETGRTHQVRIHLGESGTPLCGERVYDRPMKGQPIKDKSGAPRLALHAAMLGFVHPSTGERLQFESRLPADLTNFMAELRKMAGNPR
jgi:23S rRNA pseudouridine1911/1915/1917 synthase